MAVPDGFWDAGDPGTPDNLNQCLLQYDTAANLPSATAANKGMIYYETDTSLLKRSNGSTWDQIADLTNVAPAQATQAAIEAETNENTYIPPDMIRYSPGVAKGWVKFTVAGTDLASYNVTSITDNDTGDWTINWADDFSSTNYVVIATSTTGGSAYVLTINAMAVGTTKIWSFDVDNGAVLAEDSGSLYAAAFGDQ